MESNKEIIFSQKMEKDNRPPLIILRARFLQPFIYYLLMLAMFS